MAAGASHACALDHAGRVACWGSLTSVPEEGAPFTSIGAGFAYACGLTLDGAARCWGPNHIHSAGLDGERFIQLAVGRHHICGLLSDGAVLCSGEPNYGKLASPQGAAFIAVAAGGHQTCGLTAEGEAQCWGADPQAALPGKFTSIGAGRRTTCGTRPDGRVECWEHEDVFASGVVNFTESFDGRVFRDPVELFPWPTGGLAVAERAGSIVVFEKGAEPRTALDLTEATDCCDGENGMLSAAADPDFDEFPFLYVYYNARDSGNERALRLARFPVSDGRADPDGEFAVLEIPSRTDLHNGGAIRFGPDGMLHLGIGDDRRPESAQELGSLLGKIIRIDVRGASEERPYRIPGDNPFTDDPRARPEVWAYGLRNPWRMAFSEDGFLWVSDVGSESQEEVSIATGGANLGWPAFEGTRCRTVAACAALPDAVVPVHTYGRDEGCAVIGGAFYAGDAIPWLRGAHLFGDYCEGTVWAARRDGESAWSVSEVAKAGRPLLSLGSDEDGEVYALTKRGPILRLSPPAIAPGSGQGVGSSGTRIADGAELYAARCAACHSLDARTSGVGPHLVGLIGRRTGQVAGWNFSEALRSLDGAWTRDRLARFLADPQGFAPGTAMSSPGISLVEAGAIADYIAGLRDDGQE